MFEYVDIHIYIHRTEAYLSCKLTTEPKGSGELKIKYEHGKSGKRVLKAVT